MLSVKTMILVAILLAAIWWLLRKKYAADAGDKPAIAPATIAKSKFHAVSLRFEPNACNAAKAMAGRRFLASAPPKLPLPECDSLKCSCRFAHHDDRRSGQERRSPFGSGRTITGTGRYATDQRSGGDRRKNPG